MTRPSQPTDDTSAHVLGAVQGDSSSLDWIVSRFQPLVEAHIRYRLGARLASAADVEDLAQDVWYVTMQKLRGLEARDGHFGAVLTGFLSSTSTFLCNNFLRKRLRRGEVPIRAAGADSDVAEREIEAITAGVVTRVARSEVKSRLDEALVGLGEMERNVLVLRLLEKQSLQSISATLDLSTGAVATAYKTALDHLRRVLPRDAFDSIRSCTVRL